MFPFIGSFFFLLFVAVRSLRMLRCRCKVQTLVLAAHPQAYGEIKIFISRDTLCEEPGSRDVPTTSTAMTSPQKRLE
ncbi:hypothetical protein C0Q70_00848 [Pomacea canaliculata]|uniref:Secreted protein n=1 Tax=Pomacea canaliculata TaxID=400727 RepID=A0A2T7PXX7_POMCA|nr:hypothetical protein C0Q70_00848 [Pomacea canaliculata]